MDNASVISNNSLPGSPNKPELKAKLKELRQTAVKAQLENERLTHRIQEYQTFHGNKVRELNRELNEYKNKLAQYDTAHNEQSEQVNEWMDKYAKAQSRYQRELKNHARSLQTIKKLKQQISESAVSSVTDTVEMSNNST